MVWKGKSGRVERFVGFRGLELSVPIPVKWQLRLTRNIHASVMLRLSAYRATPRVVSLSRSLRRHLHVDYESKYSEKLQKRAQE